jgi:electron transfer flavoprotein alpha subunit
LAEEVSNIVKGLIGKGGYKNVVGLSSSIGKDVIPRVAGYFAAQPIGDITEVVVIFWLN